LQQIKHTLVFIAVFERFFKIANEQLLWSMAMRFTFLFVFCLGAGTVLGQFEDERGINLLA
jgi:hypothetical protein